MSIDPERFKEVMAHYATGVTVVTTRSEGRDYGMTVSAFASVSLEPPLVLVCIAARLFTHEQIAASGRFAVNILAEEQRAWGERFAGLVPEREDRFAGIEAERGRTGCPLLPGTLGWLECELREAHGGGDHTIFVGQVVGGQVRGGRPLLYFDRAWQRLADEGSGLSQGWASAPTED